MRLIFKLYSFGLIIVATVMFIGCNKLVEVAAPINTITTEQTFNSDANATSAVIQIYNDMVYQRGSFSIGNGLLTAYPGLSADEFNLFAANSNILQIQNNAIQANNVSFYTSMWSVAYSDIYLANAIIEGVKASSSVSDSLKKQLTGEAKFIRAFFHFYLINLFGDVPLITTTSWATTSLMTRTPVSIVYEQIISDLQDAKSLMADNYGISGGERIRPNRYAALALLARVYLYNKDWVNAETYATEVINNIAMYSLATTLGNVFIKNSSEAIWQLAVSNLYSPYATMEGNKFIPAGSTPTYYLTSQLLNAFEKGDKRKTAWLNSTFYQTTTYFYPYKYTTRQGSANGTIAQYYTVLRLGELYLIRAEARIQQGGAKIVEGIGDLNTIRDRATDKTLPVGDPNRLPSLSLSLLQSDALKAVAHERQIELFGEWGHRWFDLKRTAQADVVLSLIKPQWQNSQQLYPIPLQEIQANPNLIQNPGYN